MGFVGTWRRQAARAAGVSLLAPLALMLAAAAVATGGGLGGFSSLGQLTAGPDLPDTGLVASADSSLGDDEIVGVDVSEPVAPSTGGGFAATGDLASATPTPGAASPPAPVDVTPLPPSAAPPATSPVAPTAPTGTGTPSPPATPNPVGDLIDTTRGITESLPGPLGPTTDNVLDSLLGPN